jgi:hypothetical protein
VGNPWAAVRQRSGAVAHPAVARFEAILNYVANECEKARQFVRFAELEGGLYFSVFKPRANVIPLVMGHFAARFNVQPFIIHDPVHDIAGVYDLRRWWLVQASEALKLPPQTARETQCQDLWRTFFKSVAIEQRANPTCQRNFMPKRFWGELTEMNGVAPATHIAYNKPIRKPPHAEEHPWPHSKTSLIAASTAAPANASKPPRACQPTAVPPLPKP